MYLCLIPLMVFLEVALEVLWSVVHFDHGSEIVLQGHYRDI